VSEWGAHGVPPSFQKSLDEVKADVRRAQHFSDSSWQLDEGKKKAPSRISRFLRRVRHGGRRQN
jgi:hypothetical protein